MWKSIKSIRTVVSCFLSFRYQVILHGRMSSLGLRLCNAAQQTQCRELYWKQYLIRVLIGYGNGIITLIFYLEDITPGNTSLEWSRKPAWNRQNRAEDGGDMFLRKVGLFQRTTRRHIPEDITRHNHRHENLKCCIWILCWTLLEVYLIYTTFWKLDPFASPDVMERNDPAESGPLEGANLEYWTVVP
jgi:hypothetical protein